MNSSFTGLSEAAEHLDLFTLVFTGISLVVVGGMTLIGIYFCWKYHASRGHARGENVQNEKLEIYWTAAVLVIFMGIFYWATTLYKNQVTLPKADYEIFVYGKRWMWKFYHPNGFAEVNHLHIPKDKNVRLVLTSKDVIHSFYMPVFRVKADLMPESYTFMNLKAKKTGQYTIYCAEYCGSFHAKMGGKTTVLEEEEYLKLVGLPSKNKVIQAQEEMPGKAIYEKHGCVACHNDPSIAPGLTGIDKKYDDNFIRRSILYPQEYVEKGYEGNMPSYKGVLEEEEVNFLIQYIKSMEAR